MHQEKSYAKIYDQLRSGIFRDGKFKLAKIYIQENPSLQENLKCQKNEKLVKGAKMRKGGHHSQWN